MKGGEVERSDLSFEIFTCNEFPYDCSREVLRFTISTSHFMMGFEDVPKHTSY